MYLTDKAADFFNITFQTNIFIIIFYIHRNQYAVNLCKEVVANVLYKHFKWHLCSTMTQDLRFWEWGVMTGVVI